MSDFYKMKITMPQFVILDLLERQGESKMTEMARFSGVTTAGMTGIVDKLVKYGYCIRKSDPSDRRVVKIRPTEKGARLVKTISLHRREMTVDLFSKISQEERVEYLKILAHIKEHLK
jgi:DNA-binding MarR family transcriptional regulator